MIEEILQREYYHNRIRSTSSAGDHRRGILAVRVFETFAMRRLKAWRKRPRRRGTTSSWTGSAGPRFRSPGSGSSRPPSGPDAHAPGRADHRHGRDRPADDPRHSLHRGARPVRLPGTHAEAGGGRLQGPRAEGVVSIANSLVWITGVLFMLDNLGFRISTVIAGLGIGGIAVALAAQTLLGDLFGYFVILFDALSRSATSSSSATTRASSNGSGSRPRGSPASTVSRSSCPTRTSPIRGCATTSGWRGGAWRSGSA